MFEINRDAKNLSALQSCSFSELKIHERKELQEWLANTPDALGEELLIIQKEFAGFDDTKERLDLLALDKQGALVVIENKTDDAGKDVVWQSIKYAAYCSSLKKSDVVKIFQDYITQQNRSENASEILCDFLNVGSIDEADINPGHNQRLILVAAKFRKEVTSTIIWLIENGINAQCMKATLYKSDEKLLLDISKIVPTPETQEYMIGMSSKQIEEKETRADKTRSAQVRYKFWSALLDHFREKQFKLYESVSPSEDHWLNTGPGISGCFYTLIFLQREIRVEFNISRTSKEDSKRIFDFLHGEKDKIDNDFGDPLDWRRLEHRQSSKICFSKEFSGYDEENWPEMIEWLRLHMQKMEAAFKPVIAEIPR